MGRPPLQILGGPSPQSPIGLRPCCAQHLQKQVYRYPSNTENYTYDDRLK